MPVERPLELAELGGGPAPAFLEGAHRRGGGVDPGGRLLLGRTDALLRPSAPLLGVGQGRGRLRPPRGQGGLDVLLDAVPTGLRVLVPSPPVGRRLVLEPRDLGAGPLDQVLLLGQELLVLALDVVAGALGLPAQGPGLLLGLGDDQRGLLGGVGQAGAAPAVGVGDDAVGAREGLRLGRPGTLADPLGDRPGVGGGLLADLVRLLLREPQQVLQPGGHPVEGEGLGHHPVDVGPGIPELRPRLLLGAHHRVAVGGHHPQVGLGAVEGRLDLATVVTPAHHVEADAPPRDPPVLRPVPGRALVTHRAPPCSPPRIRCRASSGGRKRGRADGRNRRSRSGNEDG